MENNESFSSEKFNKSWKFNDEANNLIAAIHAYNDACGDVRAQIGRIEPAGKIGCYTLVSNLVFDAGVGFWFPSVTIAPHRMMKRSDVVKALEQQGIDIKSDIIGA